MLEYLKDSNWIWNPDWSAEDQVLPRIMLFRKKVVLDSAPCCAQIRISADTKYKLYVNGRLVEVGPSRGDRQVWFYDTVDLLPYLSEGANLIGVCVLRYPEDPAAGNHGMFRDRARTSPGGSMNSPQTPPGAVCWKKTSRFTGRRSASPPWSSMSTPPATR